MNRAPIKSTDELEPAWQIAKLFPPQGMWDEEDYLALDGNYLVEYSNGYIEVLPMPTTSHQLLVAFLYRSLFAFVTPQALGTVLVAALRVRLWRRKYREPDVVFMLRQHAARIGDRFWKGADLAMEVVSGGPEDRRRDLETKRLEYAKAGIAEYWVVDPREEKITVLRLAGKRYVVHGEFPKGTVATSHLLPGFRVDVTAAFAQAIIQAKRNLKRKPRR
jgi:Uma2 family endonuclease